MKPTKQTVYLQVNKDSNLTVGAFSPELDEWNSEVYVNKQEGYFFTPEQLNEYTQSVIKQTLETAAENAKVIEEELGSDEDRETPIDTFESVEFIADKGYEERSFYRYKPSKQSITNTFEETFKKFEV